MIITLHQLFLLHTYLTNILFCPENTVCFLRLLHNSSVIQTSGGGSVVVDLLFYVPPIVCGGSVLVFVLVYITLCPF